MFTETMVVFIYREYVLCEQRTNDPKIHAVKKMKHIYLFIYPNANIFEWKRMIH